MARERTIVAIVLGALGAALAVRADQPIVENYVGRQIPTAMVARNLARGSGFFRPTLDTAPFPNRFLVEPPIYAEVVAWLVRGVGFVRDRMGWPPFGFGWEAAGRLVSALMTVLGAWAFWGIARRREGPTVALVALGSFCVLPVVLKYGRAFQPDAFVVGFVWLGLRAWDEFAATDRTRWAWLGGFVLAIGLTTKVTAAWVLIPWSVLVGRWSPRLRLAAGSAMLWPALMWYLLAWGHLRTSGSHASADNAAIWAQAVSPLGWLRFATWEAVAGNLLVRAFTPVGFVLAVAGWWVAGRSRAVDRFWVASAVGFVLAVAALGVKWHHTYYWLIAAPLASVGMARALVGSFRWGCRAAEWWRANSGWCLPDDPGGPASGRAWATRGGLLASFCLGAPFVACAGWQVRNTWSEPAEWAGIREAGTRLAALVPLKAHSLLIAPEALLYYADRPGIRLEFGPEATVRAAGEWGQDLGLDEARANPLALVDAIGRANPGDPGDRFGPDSSRYLLGRLLDPDPSRDLVSRIFKYTYRAGLVADVGLITRRGEPREVFRREIRRWAEAEAIRADPAAPPGLARALGPGRPGLRILIDEPALFVFEPGRPMP